MSIRKHRYQGEEFWWAHCDICDEEQQDEALGPARTFAELQDLMASEGWHTHRDVDGAWRHFCPECWNDIDGGNRYGL